MVMVLMMRSLYFAIAIVVIVVAHVPLLYCFPRVLLLYCCLYHDTIAIAIVESCSGYSCCCCGVPVALDKDVDRGRVDVVVDIDRRLLRSETNKQ